MKGIQYTLTGERARVRINSYHNKPNVLNHSEGATDFDVQKIKGKVTRVNGGKYQSDYTIGFEIEKQRFGVGARKEYALIQGYESDSSCGYEAVTNILPLLPASQWRNKIFDMIYKAKGLMDDVTSPSTPYCGGHITIGIVGYTGSEIKERVRLNSAILLALYRKRLRNSYCSANKRMRVDSSVGKYQVAHEKRYSLEFRLPSRIRSYKQMFRRYELMYQLVDFSVTRPNGRFSSFLTKVKPIILSMYEGDTEKTEMVLQLSKHFYTYIKNGTIHNSIREFV